MLDIAKFGKGLKFPERPGLLWHGCVFRQWFVFFVQDFFHLHRFKTCCRFGDIGSGQPVSKYLQVLASPPSHVQNKMCNASVEPRRRPALRRLTVTYIVEIVAAPGRRTTEPRGSLTQSLSTLPRSFHHLMAVKKAYPKETSCILWTDSDCVCKQSFLSDVSASSQRPSILEFYSVQASARTPVGSSKQRHAEFD